MTATPFVLYSMVFKLDFMLTDNKITKQTILEQVSEYESTVGDKR